MIADLLTAANGRGAIAELLKAEERPKAGETRIVFSGISWERYLAFDRKLGQDRPGPRLYYFDGQLEIMSTSDEHERLKTWFGDFLADFFLESGIEIWARGQATIRQALKEAGAEPDESWCIRKEKKYPDLVLEIALSSGGIEKLDIYKRFKVPEVWFWRRNRLEIFAVDYCGNYQPVQTSRLLPKLNVALLERCLVMRSWQQARKTFRAALARKPRHKRHSLGG